MVKIFGVSETLSNLENLNGDCVVIPSKAVLHKYENGEFSFELEASYDYEAYFEQDRIVVVDLPFGGMEFFRMNNITKTRGKCKCKCPQILNDMKFRVQPFDGSANAQVVNTWYGLLSFMNGADGGFVGGNGIFTVTDYTVSGQTDFSSLRASTVEWEGKTFAEVLQNYIKSYGGYLYRNKMSFGVSRNRITSDRGLNIRYGSNLKSISKDEDWSDVCTYLVAVGSAGLTKSYTNSTQYTYKYNKIVNFQQSINPSDYQTKEAYDSAVEADLDAKAAAYFAEHTLPKVNYTIDAYIGEFSDGLPEIQDIGDVINVIDEKLGIDILTTVLGFDYDILAKKFTKIEFGNYANSMRGYNDKLKGEMDTVQKNISYVTYPVGTIIQNDGGNPATKGINGYWTQVSSSGGIYTWKRTS